MKTENKTTYGMPLVRYLDVDYLHAIPFTMMSTPITEVAEL